MSEHFVGSYKGFEILANSGQDPLTGGRVVRLPLPNRQRAMVSAASSTTVVAASTATAASAATTLS